MGALMIRRLFSIALLATLSACGGGNSSPTTPSTPLPATTTANRNPSVTVSVTPTSGIDALTAFTFTAVGTDPDGDTLTYKWTFSDGYAAEGAQTTRTYLSGGMFTATATVQDGRGASAQATTDAVAVASLTGRWRGSWSIYDFTMDLTQTGSLVTGTYVDRDGPGRTDPAEPGAINANGSFAVRMKQAAFGDWYFRGQLELAGKRATGTVSGPGVIGSTPFIMDKQ
jgi:hypothetical protein